MAPARKKKYPFAGWLIAGVLIATAATGCGDKNKADTPTQFSPKPTSPPINGSPQKKGDDKLRGPADKVGDS